MSQDTFEPFARLMREAGQPELAIEVFGRHYAELVAGATGLVPEEEIQPVASLPDAEGFGAHAARGRAELDSLVVIKLNGGLGTSMGMAQAKSLLPVKDGRAFIDLIAEQIVQLRLSQRARLPLVLMDSFRTQADTRAALERHPALVHGQTVPLSFLQHRVPKVLAHDLSPAPLVAGADPELAWCPPGHGDLYPALVTSGVLARLLAEGYRWAFVSNADNLGATPDDTALGILGWMAAGDRPFVMECADRTIADRKGGHLARAATDGRLLLREVAQCPPADEASFQDFTRHRYFNTNNLWLDLRVVERMLAAHASASRSAVSLPLIRNRKPLDPSDARSPAVYQLESAMGAAIALIEGAAAVRVPRGRFLPVKTTDDLLLLRSDLFVRTPEGFVRAVPERASDPPSVALDPKFYRNIQDFERRIQRAPSLIEARRLVVRGDVVFAGGVVIRGDVVIAHAADEPLVLADCVLAH
jgi:UTP--glucose-1-phosphate uridylyltransferase